MLGVSWLVFSLKSTIGPLYCNIFVSCLSVSCSVSYLVLDEELQSAVNKVAHAILLRKVLFQLAEGSEHGVKAR